MKKAIIIDIIAFLTVFLFVYAAASKVMEYSVFKVQLSRSPMTTKFAALFAWFVPTVEFVICGLLLYSKTRLLGFYAAFTLMYAFTAYISIMLLFSPQLPCSCGGVLARLEWREHLIFNVAFVILNAVGLLVTVREAPANERKIIASFN